MFAKASSYHYHHDGRTGNVVSHNLTINSVDDLSIFKYGMLLEEHDSRSYMNHESDAIFRKPTSDHYNENNKREKLLEGGQFNFNHTSIDEKNSKSASTSCTNPLEFVALPNSFSKAEYQSYRAQCTEKCNAEDYCCTKGFGGCNVIPCNEGCHIAFFAESLAACKAECERGNNAECIYGKYFNHNFPI